MAQTAVFRMARSRIGISLPMALGLLVTISGLASTKARLEDPDIMLHTVVGQWIIDHRAVPHLDIFSYTVAGTKWVAHEWLGEIITALFYDLLGWHGLVLMASLSLGTAIAIFTRALLRHYQPPHAIIIAVLAWFAITPHWLARPHMIALPFLVLWMAILVEARAANRAPHLAWALLMIPWVNLHGSFLVGIGFTGLFLVEAVLMSPGETARLKAARDWGIFGFVAIAASLVTPNGIDAYWLPIHLLHMTYTQSILVEWKSIDFQKMSTFEIWLVMFLAFALCCGIKLPIARALMVVLLFDMGLKHARHADLIVFIAPLLAAPAAAAQLGTAPARSRVALWLDEMVQPAGARGYALAAAIFVAAIGVAAIFPLAPTDKYMPVAAVRAVTERGVPGPVLNDYNYGDYLIFAGLKPFIDGRADLYGDAFIKRFYEASRGTSDGLPALLDDYHVAWTLFPHESQAVIQLDRMAGWHRLYSDDIAVVHVRDAAAPGQAPR
jgi:hypothetical protein